MRKYAWLLAIPLAMVIVGAGAAFAAADRHELNWTGDPRAPEDATGHVVLNYAEGSDKTIVQVNVRNHAPGVVHEVYMLTPVRHLVGEFETRRNGSGNLNVHMDGDHTGHLPIVVAEQDTGVRVVMTD